MIRRALTRFALCSVALIAGTALYPASADAGTYYVRSCFPDGIDRVWQPSSSAGATAYKTCPEGIHARNVISSTPAGGFTYARLVANAPAGTYFDQVTFDGYLSKTFGWASGVFDVQGNRWVWCGVTCGTLPIWVAGYNVGGFATRSLAFMTICGASTCRRDGDYARGHMAARNITLRVRDVANPAVSIVGGTLASGGWKRGVQTVDVAASDSAGVRLVRASTDGVEREARTLSCDDHSLTPCPTAIRQALRVNLADLSDGPHTLEVLAVDAGGNPYVQRRGILVDNTPPDPPERLATASAWRQSNDFSITWQSPPQTSSAPLAGVAYQICPEEPSSRQACGPTRQVFGTNLTKLTGIAVPAPDDWWLRLWLIDAAGNQNPQTSRDVALRWDPEPPSIRVLPRDEADPVRVNVEAHDPISGLASTEVELRRQGDATWHELPVNRTASGFTAVIDDDSLPRGMYVIRARATDHAGNERSAGSTITLPVRLATNLAVGRWTSTKARRAGPRLRRKILVRRPEIGFGRTIRLSGRLTSPGGNPLAGRDVDVAEQLKLPGAEWRAVATVRTNSSGRFVFKAPPGPGRLLRFRYAGTPTIRSRTAVVELRVRATSSMRVSRHRVVNGDEVVFRGRVRGEPLPVIGKLLQLQVYSRGTWLTFATPRANARGRWSHRYRFTATRGVTRYRFRVRMPREAGYPYAPGASRSVGVTVAGL